MKRLIIFLSFTFIFASAAAAQPEQIASVAHFVHKINSTHLGEERTVIVRVPFAYRGSSTAKFPVVYMLDAHPPQNAMMVGIIEQQAWGGMMPEMIVVGIQNTNRTRDLTPTKTGVPGSGGGAKFLDFVEHEVIPLVDKNYRTEPFRIFAGHSYGGLTAVYALATRPDMFNAYIAASPLMHWDDELPVKLFEKAFKERKEWNKTLFAGLGDEPGYIDSFNKFRDLLKKAGPKGFEYELEHFKDENHGSVVLPAYYAGLRKVFAGWVPPARGSFADLEDHYKKLTARFGYKIDIPEETMNRIGYQFLANGRTAEAIEAFRRNTASYPESANTYDSLAEAYEKSGDLKRAAENYEKAYKMAEKHGETRLAATAKANFDRVSKKN
ncbi:MAG: alpha/beta hydrolase-fold protein [Pyrinomonadaceae bacterium]